MLFVSILALAMAPTSGVGSFPSQFASNDLTALAVRTRSHLTNSASTDAQVLQNQLQPCRARLSQSALNSVHALANLLQPTSPGSRR